MSLRSPSWTCAKCLAFAKTNHSVRFYAYPAKERTTYKKPSNQTLSKSIGRIGTHRTTDSGFRAGPRTTSGSVRYGPLGSTYAQASEKIEKTYKGSQNRMSKTGVSVLSTVPIHDRLSTQKMTREIAGFDSLKLLPAISESIKTGALRDLDYADPTSIQALAIPAIAKSAQSSGLHTFLIAAETGSGKTLAYLTPILQHLKNEESVQHFQRKIGRPRCIILVPSAELVKQVGAVVKAMSYASKISSAFLLPKYDFRRTKNEVLMAPVDILITLPHRLSTLVDEGILKLDETKHIVIDEADSLLDISFAELVRPLIAKASRAKTLIFCSATIPRSVDAYLKNHYPDITRLVSPKIHSIPRRIATKFVDVEKDFKGDKNVAALQILRDLERDSSEPGKIKKVILFVNKRESVIDVSEYLKKKGIEALPCARDIEDRDANLAHFLHSTDYETDVLDSIKMQVLVTTDLASRGIDTTPVKTVIIYDTPHSTIDLLHRIGRTGRAGRRGAAYILLHKRRGEAWLKELKNLAISGLPLI